MQSYIIRQTNNLLRTCCNISKSNKLGVVPFPSKKFETFQELEKYNHKLYSMIETPYLFYLVRSDMKKDDTVSLIDNNPVPKIPDNYFKMK